MKRLISLLAVVAIVWNMSLSAHSFAAEKIPLPQGARAAALVAGNLGTLLLAYDGNGTTKFEEISRELRLALNDFVVDARRATVVKLGDFVDDLPMKKSLRVLDGLAAMGSTGELVNAVHALTSFQGNLVMAFDVQNILQALDASWKQGESPILTTPYGVFIGFGNDGDSLTIAAIRGAASVFVTNGSQQLMRFAVDGDSVTLPLGQVRALLGSNKKLELRLSYNFSKNAPAQVVTPVVAPLQSSVTFNSIDDFIKIIRQHAGGVSDVLNMLADNARTCTRISGELKNLSSIAGRGLLASLWTLFENFVDVLLNAFSLKSNITHAAARDADAAFLCAAIGNDGLLSDYMIMVTGEKSTVNSVLRMNDVDLPTVFHDGSLRAKASEVMCSSDTVSLEIVEYPPVSLVISGTGFGSGAELRMNGTTVSAKQQGDLFTTTEIPEQYRGVPVAVSILNTVSGKESPKFTTVFPSSDKPLSQTIIDNVLNAARKFGLRLRPDMPVNPGELFSYIQELWNSVVTLQNNQLPKGL